MRSAFIPITDHNTGDVCTNYYIVRFKIETDINYMTLPQQNAVPGGSPAGFGIYLEPLNDDTDYVYDITRVCCNGISSGAASGSFNSGT